MSAIWDAFGHRRDQRRPCNQWYWGLWFKSRMLGQCMSVLESMGQWSLMSLCIVLTAMTSRIVSAMWENSVHHTYLGGCELFLLNQVSTSLIVFWNTAVVLPPKNYSDGTKVSDGSTIVLWSIPWYHLAIIFKDTVKYFNEFCSIWQHIHFLKQP